MNSLRKLFALITTGAVWYLAFNLCFVWSGAQRILGDPERQSAKFIKAFVEYQPLPRMTDVTILWKGFFLCGVLSAAAFLLAGNAPERPWWKHALRFAVIHWLIMVPWFEFYLPYNVMNEPLPLVLFEAGIWFAVLTIVSFYLSFIVYFRLSHKIT